MEIEAEPTPSDTSVHVESADVAVVPTKSVDIDETDKFEENQNLSIVEDMVVQDEDVKMNTGDENNYQSTEMNALANASDDSNSVSKADQPILFIENQDGANNIEKYPDHTNSSNDLDEK
jgi:hypothetical protein